jgi:hypothetical protein
MNIRSPQGVALAALIVFVGLAIGGWLAVATRPNQQTQTAAVPMKRSLPNPSRANAPSAVPTRIVAAARTATASAPAAPPTTSAVAATGGHALQGAWQITEGNVHVGTIVWAGTSVARGDKIVLDVHKESVGGRSAVPCERQTNLHTAIVVGVAQQTVPFQEVNCQGDASNGEIRVTQFSPDGRAFSGTFWQDGAKLGSFDARQR